MELGDEVELDGKQDIAMFLREEFCGQHIILNYKVLREIPGINQRLYVKGDNDRYLRWDLTKFEYEFVNNANDLIDPVKLKVTVYPEKLVEILRVA